jgi:hypothetical protein
VDEDGEEIAAGGCEREGEIRSGAMGTRKESDRGSASRSRGESSLCTCCRVSGKASGAERGGRVSGKRVVCAGGRPKQSAPKQERCERVLGGRSAASEVGRVSGSFCAAANSSRSSSLVCRVGCNSNGESVGCAQPSHSHSRGGERGVEDEEEEGAEAEIGCRSASKRARSCSA